MKINNLSIEPILSNTIDDTLDHTPQTDFTQTFKF